MPPKDVPNRNEHYTGKLATATSTLAPPRLSCCWIISRRADLAWISGSALAGYVYLALHVLFAVPLTYLWWFWSVGFDGTHIFATTTRTYLDREARSGRRTLLFGSLAFFFAVGPLLVLAGAKAILALLVGVWAYYHVIRQHYGFLVLYKVKNRDLGGNLMERLFLGAMLVFPPLHRFFVHHPGELGLPARMALDRIPGIEPVLWISVLAAAAVYLWRLARSPRPLNLPKLLLLAGIVPLHWLTFAFMSWQAAVPTVTIVHNLQYHALVWFHNRNRYGGDGEARHGRAPRALSRSLLAYAAAALVFSLLYRVPGFHLGRVSDLAFGFFCGFGLTHYYLDSRIWRVRGDPGLREALALA